MEERYMVYKECFMAKMMKITIGGKFKARGLGDRCQALVPS
jgi:hypothetical protein